MIELTDTAPVALRRPPAARRRLRIQAALAAPVFAVLSDAEGTAWLTPADLTTAEPDPFCQLEQDWLRHLDHAHPVLLHILARHIFARGPAWLTAADRGRRAGSRPPAGLPAASH